MIKRVLLSVFVALVVGFGTVRLWQALKLHDADQIARLAEAESHAARNELIRHLEVVLESLLLPLGMVIAVLMAALAFEYRRAHSRAIAAERRLDELNRNLEMEIANRTKELANRTSDLQTITNSVAHDLRNSLNVISVNVQLFEIKFGDALTPESAAVLQRITRAVHQMADILERLRGLSDRA